MAGRQVRPSFPGRQLGNEERPWAVQFLSPNDARRARICHGSGQLPHSERAGLAKSKPRERQRFVPHPSTVPPRVSKSKKQTIKVQGTSVAMFSLGQDDRLSLTDIARYKNPDHPDDVIRNWLRSRSTVEFLGVWERLNNPHFNPVEFDGIRMQTGLNTFVLTPKQWIEKRARWASPRARGGTAAPTDILKASIRCSFARDWRNQSACARSTRSPFRRCAHCSPPAAWNASGKAPCSWPLFAVRARG